MKTSDHMKEIKATARQSIVLMSIWASELKTALDQRILK